MVTMSVPNRTLCPTLKGFENEDLFDKKRLKPRELPDNDTMGFISSFSIFRLVS